VSQQQNGRLTRKEQTAQIRLDYRSPVLNRQHGERLQPSHARMVNENIKATKLSTAFAISESIYYKPRTSEV